MHYFQMQITIGIEAANEAEADTLRDKLVAAVAAPLHGNNTDEAVVFETFATQVYPYPDED